jgi:hypothetical protein
MTGGGLKTHSLTLMAFESFFISITSFTQQRARRPAAGLGRLGYGQGTGRVRAGYGQGTGRAQAGHGQGTGRTRAGHGQGTGRARAGHGQGAGQTKTRRRTDKFRRLRHRHIFSSKRR